MTIAETLNPESSSKKATSHLLMEWGHSRIAIAARIKAAAPHLTLFSPSDQPVAGTELMPFPRISKAGDLGVINRLIEEYDIDAFWPQNGAKYDLSGINADVHAAASPEVVRLVDDKIAFNEWLGDDPYSPLSVEATGVEAISAEVERLKAHGIDVCIKPVIGVGGNGYWRLNTEESSIFLNKPEKRIMHPSVYLSALALEETVTGPQRMMLMDYLPGPEVSVDLLAWRGKPLVHAARTKEDFATSQRIQSEHEVIEHSHSIASRLGFHGIISLQYRLDTEGNWKMLEINPRPAGGSIYSEDAGFGIISNWTKLVTGEIDPSDVRQHHGDTVLKKR